MKYSGQENQQIEYKSLPPRQDSSQAPKKSGHSDRFNPLPQTGTSGALYFKTRHLLIECKRFVYENKTNRPWFIPAAQGSRQGPATNRGFVSTIEVGENSGSCPRRPL